jgi:hypothetical protein
VSTSRKPSETRQELEKALRRLVPSRPGSAGEETTGLTALAGVGGLASGFLWGWVRGRRGRSAK